MALFNNGYPASYPQMFYPQMQQQFQPQQQQQGNSIIWVSGEAGAKAYMVAPNSTVQLWDSESQTIFLKSADASGMPSIKILDYTIRESGQNLPPVTATPQQTDYATREEVDALTAQIKAVKKQIEAIKKEAQE